MTYDLEKEPDTFAVVNFRLIQRQSFPFVLSVNVASDSFMQAAEDFLEKNAVLTIWQGDTPQRYVSGFVSG
ncbi:type VI secretion system tip protein VgrG, partial [Salmonella enterica]|nr:type VI secretion system tip protein VgrG [Salmonella enterica]